MFSLRPHVLLVMLVACSANAIGLASEASAPPEVTQAVEPRDFLETQLDWRSYYLLRPQARRGLTDDRRGRLESSWSGIPPVVPECLR